MLEPVLVPAPAQPLKAMPNPSITKNSIVRALAMRTTLKRLSGKRVIILCPGPAFDIDPRSPLNALSAKSELDRYAPRAQGAKPAARYIKKKTPETPPARQTQGQETPQPAGGQKSPGSGSKRRRPPAKTASSSTTKTTKGS
jgi:hypothetical protein